jgi:hypothetical protein
MSISCDDRMLNYIISNIINLCDLLNKDERDYANAQCIFIGEIDIELDKKAKNFVLLYEEEMINHFIYNDFIELIIAYSIYDLGSNHYGKYVKKIVEGNNHEYTQYDNYLSVQISYDDNDDKKHKIVNFIIKEMIKKYTKQYIKILIGKCYSNLVDNKEINASFIDNMLNTMRDNLSYEMEQSIDRMMRYNRHLLFI